MRSLSRADDLDPSPLGTDIWLISGACLVELEGRQNENEREGRKKTNVNIGVCLEMSQC